MNLGISVQEAKLLLDSEMPPRLVDVREPDEFAICRIPGAELVSLSVFAEEHSTRLADPAQRIILYCHHGMRSMRAAEYLAQRGFSNVSSMDGGIDAWSRQIDLSIAKY